MAGGFQSDKDRQDWLALNPADQIRFLQENDPDFAKLSADDKNAYIDHVKGVDPGTPQEPGITDRLLSGAQKFSESHPVLGAAARLGASALNTAASIPGGIYHAVADPVTPAEQAEFDQGGWTRHFGEVGAERLLGARPITNALRDYGIASKDQNSLPGVSASGAASVLPEALGQGIGAVGAAKLAGQAPRAISGISERTGLSDYAASKLRKPATAAQAKMGEAGTPRLNIPFAKGATDMILPKGRLGSDVHPGRFMNISDRVRPELLREEAAAKAPVQAEQGLPKIKPATTPQDELGRAWSGEQPGLPYQPNPQYTPPPEPAAPIPSRGGLMLGSGKPIEGEVLPPASSPRLSPPIDLNRMPRPISPLISTPEEYQVFQNQMRILQNRAKVHGMYSAAEGATDNPTSYGTRIGKRLIDPGQ